MSNIYDICLIGLGPAGIGFLSSLDKSVLKSVICFEKGNQNCSSNCHAIIDSKCTHCKQCNIVSGLGGASRFSCGKISNFPAGSGLQAFFDSNESLTSLMNSMVDILKEKLALKKIVVSTIQQKKMEAFFSQEGITYKYYDVYEFSKDLYISYIHNIVNEAKDLGTNFLFNTEVISVEKKNIKNESVFEIIANKDGAIIKQCARKVVMATGNIDRNIDLFGFLSKDKLISSYEIGIRIEVPTKMISSFLDAHGDLKLKYKDGRTYCVSKNGFIIAYNSTKEGLLLEGYTDCSQLSDKTNLAIILKKRDLSDLESFKSIYLNSYNGIPIAQRYIDYTNNRISNINWTTPLLSVQPGNINCLFSDRINSEIVDFIDSVIVHTMGLTDKEIIIYAPELKNSYNINFKEGFQVTKDLYVIGAATGKFRGILQSLCSGIHCAKFIIRR